MLKYKYYPPYLILLSIAAPQCLISQLRQARERLAKQDARARIRSSSGAFACECAEQLTESRKLCTAAWRCRGYRGIPPVLLFFCRRFLFQIKRKCRNAGSIYRLIMVCSEGRNQLATIQPYYNFVSASPISDSRKGCPYEPCTIFNCSKSYEKSVPPLVGSVRRAVFDIIKKVGHGLYKIKNGTDYYHQR